MENSERKILDMVEQGQITADEGLRLMNAMGKGTVDPQPEAQEANGGVARETNRSTGSYASHISLEEVARMNRLKNWWLLPFSIGLVILFLGAIWMYAGYRDAGFGFSFWIAWVPFLLGIFIVAVSARTSKSVWFHLKVKQAPGEKPEQINLSLPLPLNLAKWFFTAFGEKITGLDNKVVGDIPAILENLSPEEPFYVHVNDDDDGEEVEIYIG
ncbi:hypothetical protein JR338_04370 [Chloroflexota bacterium]|nr:hypothetical protein JR338_04370 [Chloroflexota bacterium]